MGVWMGYRVIKRVMVAGVVLVLGLVALGGCALGVPKDGQSEDQANKSTVLPEGVAEISATYSSSLDGFNRRYQVTVAVTVADGFVVTDSDSLMDWLVGVGWSINDHEPTLLRIKVLYESGARVEVDSSGVVSRFSLYIEDIAIDLEADQSIYFGASKVEPVLGSWPGKVPETPSGLFVRAP